MGSRRSRMCCLCRSRFVIRLAMVLVVMIWTCIFFTETHHFYKQQRTNSHQRGLEGLLKYVSIKENIEKYKQRTNASSQFHLKLPSVIQPYTFRSIKAKESRYSISDPDSSANMKTSSFKNRPLGTSQRKEPHRKNAVDYSKLTNKTNARHLKITSDIVQCHDDFQKEFEEKKQYLCTHLYGGIGNYMFAYASVYGMARAVNRTVVLHTDNPLLKYFKVKAKVIKDFCICLNVKVVDEGKSGVFNKDLMNLTEHRNYRPSLYLQSWRYFKDVEEDIREQFTFTGVVLDTALQRIQDKIGVFRKARPNMESKPVITVGIHVRKGDITEKKKFLDFGYQIAPPKYFKHAMAYFRKKYDSPLFLVCSDDIQWCKEKITGSDVMYMEGNSYAVDMGILTHCNHTIISVGSFGWWAGYLSKGETIYYKHPVKNGSVLMSQFSVGFVDYFHPDWIGME